jgi:hypothetical protein
MALSFLGKNMMTRTVLWQKFEIRKTNQAPSPKKTKQENERLFFPLRGKCYRWWLMFGAYQY